jgi:hypothetical protein
VKARRLHPSFPSFHFQTKIDKITQLLITMMLSTLQKAGARVAARTAARVTSRGFAKEIKFGVDGRNAMLAGVNTLADAVQVSILATSGGPAWMKPHERRTNEAANLIATLVFFSGFCCSLLRSTLDQT